jgi:soluble lytic murein transglycosylase-like protein
MRAAVLFLIISLPGTVLADSIYRYVDENGRVVLTNLGSNRTPAPVSLVEAAKANPRASALLARQELYRPLIEESAKRHSVSPELVQAIIRVESNFNPDAVSHKNCKGLMQLLPDTARRFGVIDIFDPSQNIEGGVKYLRFLFNHFENDLSLVLAAYNAGENAVTRHKGIPPYRETQEYVKKVSALYKPAEGPKEDVLAQAGEPRPINRKIYRVVQSNGRVLFTNTPTEAVVD